MSLRPSSLLSLLAALLASFASLTRAHSNGMDMSMDGAMDLAAGQMLPYLHFTPGDIVLFYGWVPSSKSAMVGTCIGLFLLALVERWIAACRAVMESHWRLRAKIAQADKMNLPSPGEKPVLPSGRLRDTVTLRNAPPFIPAHDLARGVLHAVQVAMQFAFMLIVMTFQVSFILSIVIGLGAGETLFGRFASHAALHG
ncbi:CTR copper uptake transporter [Pilatotrama ljubarskyi]|nr:CTR copper uptake transporter [Pilatotrama ljubarskyi]